LKNPVKITRGTWRKSEHQLQSKQSNYQLPQIRIRHCRIIREEESPRPSTRLTTLDAGEQTTVAKRRQAQPPKLAGLVRGDLDWIVMKCLEKDRHRRYDTDNGLAQDLQRHLDQKPVEACPW
jgi:hypothetical protein